MATEKYEAEIDTTVYEVNKAFHFVDQLPALLVNRTRLPQAILKKFSKESGIENARNVDLFNNSKAYRELYGDYCEAMFLEYVFFFILYFFWHILWLYCFFPTLILLL